jgi:hypothetical protein
MNEANEYITRFQAMKSAAQVQFTLFDQVAKYCCPRKGDILNDNSPGRIQTLNIYDNTAQEAGGVFASGCITNICPPGEKWFRTEPKDREASQETKEWFDALTDAATDVVYDSNFFEGMHEIFNDEGHFGTACIWVDYDKVKLVNFIPIPAGSYAYSENNRGEVDTVVRWWQWTARQAAQEWGEDKLGKLQQESLRATSKGGANRKFTYFQLVEPRKIGDLVEDGEDTPDSSKRPWKGCYVCVEDKMVMEETGYYTNPAIVARLLKKNGDPWGSGPGLEILPTVRMINAVSRDVAVGIEKGVKPGYLLPDDGSVMIDARPDGRSYWDSTNPAGKPERWSQEGNMPDALTFQERLEIKIQRAYYNHLFQFLLQQDEMRKQKTAYEVEQMVAQQLNLFSPLFGRMTRELLGPIITRLCDMLFRESQVAWLQERDGILPIPPLELRGKGVAFNITYVSKIALAVKAYENQSAATAIAFLQQAAPIDPSIVHKLDMPAMFDGVMRNVGVPHKWIRTDRKMRELAAAQAAAQAQQQAPEQAKLASEAVKNLSEPAAQQAARKLLASQQAAA